MNRFIWKLILNALIVIPLLYWYTNATIVGIALATLTLVIVSYVIGDQFILRQSNNLIATIADAAIAYFFLWGVSYFYEWGLSTGELIVIVVGIAIAEAIFHAMLLRVWGEQDKVNTSKINVRKQKIATQEFGEELSDTDRAVTKKQMERNTNTDSKIVNNSINHDVAGVNVANDVASEKNITNNNQNQSINNAEATNPNKEITNESAYQPQNMNQELSDNLGITKRIDKEEEDDPNIYRWDD